MKYLLSMFYISYIYHSPLENELWRNLIINFLFCEHIYDVPYSMNHQKINKEIKLMEHRIMVIHWFLKNKGKQFCEKLYRDFMSDCVQGVSLEVALNNVEQSFNSFPGKSNLITNSYNECANVNSVDYFLQLMFQFQPNAYLFFPVYPPTVYPVFNQYPENSATRIKQDF